MIEGENTPFKDKAINTNSKHINKVFGVCKYFLQRFSCKLRSKLCLGSLIL